MSRTGTSLKTKTPVNRHRYGDLNEVVVPVESGKTAGANEIATGGMVFIPPSTNTLGLTAGTAYPNSRVVVGSVDTIANYFAGVAMDSSTKDDSDDIMIATTGVFEFALASSQTVKVGDAVCLSDAGTSGDGGSSCDCFTASVKDGVALSGAWNDAHRIGTAVSKGTSQTTVLCRINSRLFEGNHAS